MPRFFQQAPEGDYAVLTGENAAHARVLRLKRGDAVTICDGAGTDYLCSVDGMGPDPIRLTVLEARPSPVEPQIRVSVFMAFAKADKLEHVIQKATELGAYEIVAFPSARCVSRPDAKSLPKKLERWQKIAASAAEQSGRGQIPQVRAAASFPETLELAAQKELRILLYENERRVTFRSQAEARAFATAAIVTGPEGGFEESEAVLAQEAGLTLCTLGPRILRCETAPLCALSALLYAHGAFD